MAKGAIAKNEITNRILEYFPNAFLNDKEIRIPFIENGEMVEIKFTLTCAKTNIGGDRSNEIPTKSISVSDMIEPTAQEKEKVKELLNTLNF